MLQQKIVPDITEGVKAIFVKPTGGSRPRVETVEAKIRRLYDMSGTTIKCPVSVPPIVHVVVNGH